METVESTAAVVNNLSIFAPGGIMDFLIRYGINIAVAFILIRLLYYPRHRNKDFVFTFFLFNTVNFLICFLLSSTKIKIGFAFGLFAIFSILRYRTVSVPVREMGYFFISVTIGIINALAGFDLATFMNSTSAQAANGQFMGAVTDLSVLLLSNALILVMVYLLDRQLSLDHENWKDIVYERIDLIKPESRPDMISDLNNRTGLPVHRVEILKIDFLRDIARIRAFYFSKENENSSIGSGSDDD